MSQYQWEEAGKHNPWGKKRVRGTHCSKGHEFTEENTFIRAYDNARVCRECRKQYAREKYQRNKAKNGGVARPKKDKPQVFELADYLQIPEDVRGLWYNLQATLKDTKPNCDEKPYYYVDNPVGIDDDTAEQMCYGCPLLKQCYDFAVASDVNWGVWGGINFTKEEDYNELDGE